jgi:ZIP family zinc transporter
VPAVFLYSLIPIATTLLGAGVAAVRPPGRSLRSAIQHFAAGVVFSVVAVELLPDVTRVHDLVEIGWTFAAGVLLMLIIEALSKRFGGDESSKGEGMAEGPSAGQLVAIGIDILIDGLLVGIAFAAGAKEGVLLVLALSLELLSLGLSIASSLASSGAGRVRTVLVPTGLSVLLVVGAVAGDTVLAGASEHTLAGVLSFGCAALLYLVTEELLVEAHEAAETTFATTMFFAGFLLFLMLGMLE